MSTSPDPEHYRRLQEFSGLRWLCHELAGRDDLVEHQRVEMVWRLFPSAPHDLIITELATHARGRCAHGALLSEPGLVQAYRAWRPGTISSDSIANAIYGDCRHHISWNAACPQCGRPEAPEASAPPVGHQFHFAVWVQGSHSVEGDAQATDEPADGAWTRQTPFRLTVRAPSLRVACRIASEAALMEWRCSSSRPMDIYGARERAARALYAWTMDETGDANWDEIDESRREECRRAVDVVIGAHR